MEFPPYCPHSSISHARFIVTSQSVSFALNGTFHLPISPPPGLKLRDRVNVTRSKSPPHQKSRTTFSLFGVPSRREIAASLFYSARIPLQSLRLALPVHFRRHS